MAWKQFESKRWKSKSLEVSTGLVANLRHTKTHREYLADKKHDVLGGELSPPGCHILCLMDLHDHKQQ
jgi:hypothetical protein